MPRRVALVVLTLVAPRMATAQGLIPPSSVLSSPAVAVGGQRLEPLCDGTEMRQVEIQRDIGKGMMLGGLAVALLGGAVAGSHGQHALAVVLTGGVLGLGGAVVAGTAYPSESFWQVTLAHAQVGLTTPEDVRTCLLAPSGHSVAGAEEELTYRARPSGVFRWGHWESTVRFTFDNGVLKQVRRSEKEMDDVAGTRH